MESGWAHDACAGQTPVTGLMAAPSPFPATATSAQFCCRGRRGSGRAPQDELGGKLNVVGVQLLAVRQPQRGAQGDAPISRNGWRTVVLTTLPILILYVAGRRQLLSGLTAGFSK
jgi:hypothetical protein